MNTLHQNQSALCMKNQAISLFYFYWFKWDVENFLLHVRDLCFAPEDFQFPVILRFSCFSLFSCNQVTCVKTSFFSPIFQRLEEIMVISCQQTKNAKNEIAAEVFQSICSRFGSYQKQRMNRGIPAALLLIIDRWLRDAMTTESLLLRCFCAALILFMMCDACQQLFPLGW